MADIDKWINDCLRKKRYKTLDFAEKTRIYTEGKLGKKFHIYLCEHCQNYHLATTKGVLKSGL